jgi:hypothetical protein
MKMQIDGVEVELVHSCVKPKIQVRQEPAESLTEAELEAFDKPAREVFKASLSGGADPSTGDEFMRWYIENAGLIGDVGKEERQAALETRGLLRGVYE